MMKDERMVAGVGGARFASLQEALEAGGSSGKTVTLLADVDGIFTVPEGGTLDLNGKTVSGGLVLVNRITSRLLHQTAGTYVTVMGDDLHANGLAIVASERQDGEMGTQVSWTTNGTDYSYDLPAIGSIYGGGYDVPVTGGTSVTVRGGAKLVCRCVFGGGACDAAKVSGDVRVRVMGGTFEQGIVGGGGDADVEGNIIVTIGAFEGGSGLRCGPTIGEAVIGGCVYGDVMGDISVDLFSGTIGTSKAHGLITGDCLEGVVQGAVNVNVIDFNAARARTDGRIVFKKAS